MHYSSFHKSFNTFTINCGRIVYTVYEHLWKHRELAVLYLAAFIFTHMWTNRINGYALFFLCQQLVMYSQQLFRDFAFGSSVATESRILS